MRDTTLVKNDTIRTNVEIKEKIATTASEHERPKFNFRENKVFKKIKDVHISL